MPIEPQPNVAARPDSGICPLPPVLSAADIGRVLQVSRPVAYDVLHQCKPFMVGRLQRCFAEDFRAFLERQRGAQ